MKITLKNFRCYEDQSFDFGDHGLTLLSGGSGTGKTSLMMAIDFALFGVQSQKKYVMNGKRSCTVELEIKNLKIIRSNSPKRLLVSDKNTETTYEDAAGEAVIQKVFGKIFNSVSYIPQNFEETFFGMSPSKRLEFLETFAFNNVDIAQVKDRAKEEIKQANLELERVSAQLQFATQTYESTPKPEFQKYPLKLTGTQTEDHVKSLLQTKIQNAVSRIKKSQELLENLKTQKRDEEILKAILNEKEQGIQILQEKILSTKKELHTILEDFPHLSETLKATEELLQQCLNYREAMCLLKKIEDEEERILNLKKAERTSLEDILKTKESELWESIPKDEVDDQIQFWKELKEASQTIKHLEQNFFHLGTDKSEELARTEAELLEAETKLSKLMYFHKSKLCPNCSKRLCIGDDGVSLVLVQDESIDLDSTIDNLDQHISRLKKLKERLSENVRDFKMQKESNDELFRKISELKQKIDSSLAENPELVSEIESQYQEMINYKSLNLKLATEISTIKRQLSENIYSPTILSLEKLISKDKTHLEQLSYKDDIQSLHEEDVRQRLSSLKEKHRIFIDLESRLDSFQKDCAAAIHIKDKLILEHQQKYSSFSTSIDEKISIVLKTIEENQHKRDDALRLQAKVDKYEEYKKWLKNWENLKSQKEHLENKEKEAKRKYASALLLKDKITQSESIALANIIDNVNSHISLYLDLFFPNHPITIRIKPYREVKGESKPEINLEIDYKGIEHDKTMLSGGEMSRVILAFTLAFAEIQGSPLLLLDECTASLDQDLTSTVIEGLKENFGEGKLLLLIAHQVVQGSFDRVIML